MSRMVFCGRILSRNQDERKCQLGGHGPVLLATLAAAIIAFYA
jgi:hypothetical protein